MLLEQHVDWYLTNNSFNEIRVNEHWLECVTKSTKLGYEGLRAVGDTSWLEKCYYRTFAHYEDKINKMLPELPFIALCLYDENKTDKLNTVLRSKQNKYSKNEQQKNSNYRWSNPIDYDSNYSGYICVGV